MLQGIAQTNPIRDLAPEVVVPMSGNQPPVGWQLAQHLLGPHKAPLLRAWVPSRQVDPTRTPDEEQVSRVVDSMSVDGDMARRVAG